ncbi:MAG: transglycosylase SLT domain-containing protein, partial [Burkholderiales bacterium]
NPNSAVDLRLTALKAEPSAPRTSTPYAAGRAPLTATAEHRAWAHAVSTQYRIAPHAALVLVQHTARAAQSYDLELSLLLAIIGVESGFNPLAQSPVGAQGLMQVMPDVHAERFDLEAGRADPLDPMISTTVGAAILREYWDLCRGERVCALQRYNGALFDRSARYAQRIGETENRLRAAAGRPLVPARLVTMASALRDLSPTPINSGPL